MRELYINNTLFQMLRESTQPFEIRLEVTDVMPGDKLRLLDPADLTSAIEVEVTAVLPGPVYGVPEGWALITMVKV
ncbi:MAG: hypothetical protein GWN00_01040 [Aliifodinibius sp.]|nr:hypothetical protein [Fodinibius sp.]NIV09916.1 hypothetical protein [Fodinibius sp.]NIY23446.1 hypothetical protein [Fodinibius sp.]